MRLRKQQPSADADERTVEARKRASHIATHDLYDWADQCQYVCGKGLTEYREHLDQPNFIEEAVFAAEVLLVITQEIHRRSLSR